MITIILGILSSVAAEIVTALNKKLAGTVLKGTAAFLVAFGIALPGAILKEVLMPGFSFHELLNYTKLLSDFSEVFAVSQVYFLFVAQQLNLDVKSTPDTTVAVVTTTEVAAPGTKILG